MSIPHGGSLRLLPSFLRQKNMKTDTSLFWCSQVIIFCWIWLQKHINKQNEVMKNFC